MSKRVARSVALMVGAGALVLGAAAPAMAADNAFTNDTLPGKVSLKASESATVTLTTPDGFNCASWDVNKKNVGQKRARGSVQVTLNGATCVGSVATFTVMVVPEYTKKANVVVKFIVTNDEGTAKSVETLVVKVNKDAKPQTGKPDNAGKPDSD